MYEIFPCESLGRIEFIKSLKMSFVKGSMLPHYPQFKLAGINQCKLLWKSMHL